MRGDRGDVILGWFTKIAVVLGLFGLVGFDAVSVGVAKMNAQDTADTAAGIGSDAWNSSHDVRQAYKAAVEYADEHNAHIAAKSFTVAQDGTVRLTLTTDATTVLLYRTKTTKKWTHVVATGARRSV
jgi:hypothetical protein